MKVLLAASCLLLLAQLALAAPAKQADQNGCCVPEQMEGKMVYAISQAGKGWKNFFLTEGTIHFDFKNSRIGSWQGVDFGWFQVLTQTVMDWKNKAVWIHQPANKYCGKFPLPGSYYRSMGHDSARPGCITYDFIFKGTQKLGYGTESMNTTVIEFDTPSPAITQRQYMSPKCWPMATITQGEAGNVKLMQAGTFGELKEGIKDFKVFDLPDICPKSDSDFAAGPPTFLQSVLIHQNV